MNEKRPKLWHCLQSMLWLGLCFLLLLTAFGQAQWLAEIYPAQSLRYATPLSAQQVETALRYATSEKNAAQIYPSFWSEKATASLHAKGFRTEHTVEAMAISFRGEAAVCYPASFVRGGYPGSGDTFGCAVSQELAWQLWGSNDVLGQNVVWQSRTYTVCGVFVGKDAVMMAGARLGESFPNVELTGNWPDDARAAALQFAARASLGSPAQMVQGPAMAALAQALCWLPVVVTSAFVGAAMWRKSKKWPRAHRNIFLFGLALCAAVLLPRWLSLVPGMLIPAQWSDFAFWGTLWDTLCMRVREWLSLVPTQKDVQAKLALVTLCASVLALCIAAEKTNLVISQKAKGEACKAQ